MGRAVQGHTGSGASAFFSRRHTSCMLWAQPLTPDQASGLQSRSCRRLGWD